MSFFRLTGGARLVRALGLSRRWYRPAGPSRTSVRWLQRVELGPADSVDGVALVGWLRFVRRHKDIVFLGVDDGSSASPLQVVVPAALAPKEVALGSCIRASGDLHASAGRGQAVELRGREVEVLSEGSAEHPLLGGRRVLPETARQLPHLRPQLPHFAALWRLRHCLETSVRGTLDAAGFFHVHTPLLTQLDCEGAGETLSLRDGRAFFADGEAGADVHLTVSAQLHLEAAAAALGSVYTLSPAWRGEKSLTRHHLAEFYMLEVESVYLDSEAALCAQVEETLREVGRRFLAAADEADLALVGRQLAGDSSPAASAERIQAFAESDFLRMTFHEALDVLAPRAAQFQVAVGEGSVDLGKEHERFLSQYVGGRPLFVTGFPSEAKPFYCALSSDGRAQAVDLILPAVGEVVGGSVRETDTEMLARRMRTVGGDGLAASMQWYLDLRKLGGAPHGGYGVGFDRLLQFLAGAENIRDVVPFPRFYGSCRL